MLILMILSFLHISNVTKFTSNLIRCFIRVHYNHSYINLIQHLYIYIMRETQNKIIIYFNFQMDKSYISYQTKATNLIHLFIIHKLLQTVVDEKEKEFMNSGFGSESIKVAVTTFTIISATNGNSWNSFSTCHESHEHHHHHNPQLQLHHHSP